MLGDFILNMHFQELAIYSQLLTQEFNLSCPCVKHQANSSIVFFVKGNVFY